MWERLESRSHIYCTMLMVEDADNVLEVRELRTRFFAAAAGDGVAAGAAAAVDGVDFAVRRGRTLALVGESGSGKTTTALSLMRLIPHRAGRIVSGQAWLRTHAEAPPLDLLALDEAALRRVRGAKLAMIFQDPATALNPVLRVGTQLVEALRLHQPLSRRAARRQAGDLLARVGLDDPGRRLSAFPHELSGGMQQRVMLAMALACRPALLIADEPTSALDVTVQAQILELLGQVQRDQGTALLLITHDMGVVAQLADEVCVMSAGRIVERGATARVFAEPRHDCTRRLLRAAPRLAGAGRTGHV